MAKKGEGGFPCRLKASVPAAKFLMGFYRKVFRMSDRFGSVLPDPRRPGFFHPANHLFWVMTSVYITAILYW